MAGNAARELLSNGTDDRVTVFDDGRIKVWSPNHLWVVESSERHTVLGESVLLTVGRFLGDPDEPGKREIPRFVVRTDPSKGRTSAGAVGISNGSFVEFLHDGSIIVGNDVRDIKETFNGGREHLVKSKSGRGGSVMVTFLGHDDTPNSAELRPHDRNLGGHPPRPESVVAGGVRDHGGKDQARLAR